MESRIQRYANFINSQYTSNLVLNDEYIVEYINDEIQEKIEKGKYEKIIFTGMGCSAIVSDLIKGFFVSINNQIDVEVINDYNIKYFTSLEDLRTKNILVIISSYSGFSKEPLRAYYEFLKNTKDIIFLTSGGKLSEIAKNDKVSLIKWNLSKPDREYPLFHVPQYFSILLKIFKELKFLEEDYSEELLAVSIKLEKALRDNEFKEKANKLANQIYKKELILLGTPIWYQSLLKILKMHINEVAMAPAHTNHFHEFCHSEVAVYSKAFNKRAVIIIKDKHEDQYTIDKMYNLKNLLSVDKEECYIYDVYDGNYIYKLFHTLLFFQMTTCELAKKYNIKSRELISSAAGNKWYSQEVISKELSGKN